MCFGKKIRLKNIFREDEKALIVAMDHAAIAGAMQALENPEAIIRRMVKNGADALLLTRGMLEKGQAALGRKTGVILRISGGFTILTDPVYFEDHIISSVETALRWNADAVAITIKYGHTKENEFIREASKIADLCNSWGMPLMIEVMVQGQRVEKFGVPESLAIACRAAFELGADFIKTSYSGSTESMQKIVAGCPIPIVILGGEKSSDEAATLSMVKNALTVGVKGIAFGRNIWASKNPETTLAALQKIIH